MSYAQIHFRKLKFEFLDSIQLLENYGLKKKKILTNLLTWYLYSTNINTYIHSIHMNLNLLDQSQSKVWLVLCTNCCLFLLPKYHKYAVPYSFPFLVYLGAVQPDRMISLAGFEFPIMNLTSSKFLGSGNPRVSGRKMKRTPVVMIRKRETAR